MTPDVAEAAGQSCLFLPFGVWPNDLDDSRRRSCAWQALGNDPLVLQTLSDKRSLLPIGPPRHTRTNPAAPLGVTDDQGPLCP
jgi:hypothetical protein